MSKHQEPIKHRFPLYFTQNLFYCGKCESKFNSFMAMSKHYNDFHLQAFLKIVVNIDKSYKQLLITYQSDANEEM